MSEIENVSEPEGQENTGDSPALLSSANAPSTEGGSDASNGKNGAVKDGSNAGEQAQMGAPESYADFKLPEGMEIKAEALEVYKSKFKELGLSQEAAQSLVDVAAQNSVEGAKRQQAQIEQDYITQRNDWAKETIAALGPNYQEKMGVAAKARDAFGTPELTEMLKETGLENNLQVVNFFLKVGNAISEDRLVYGVKPNTIPGLTAEERMEQRIAAETK